MPNLMLLNPTKSMRHGATSNWMCQSRFFTPIMYLEKGFILYLKQKGTEQKLTIHDIPAQNGVAKHHNQPLSSIFVPSSMPVTSQDFCGEARHIVWLMNQTTTKTVEGMTPYEAAFGKKPDLQNVHEWGKKVWVQIEGCWMGVDE